MSKNGYADSIVIGQIMNDGELYNPKLHRRFLVERVMYNESRHTTDSLQHIAKYYAKQIRLMGTIELKLKQVPSNYEKLDVYQFSYSRQTIEELLYFNRVEILKEALLILAYSGYIRQKNGELAKVKDLNNYMFRQYVASIKSCDRYDDLKKCYSDAKSYSLYDNTKILKVVKNMYKALLKAKNTEDEDLRLESLKKICDYYAPKLEERFLHDNIDTMLNDKLAELFIYIIEYKYDNIYGYYEENSEIFEIIRRLTANDLSVASKTKKIPIDHGNFMSINIIDNYVVSGLFYAIHNQVTFKDYYGISNIPVEMFDRQKLFEIVKNDKESLHSYLKVNTSRY